MIPKPVWCILASVESVKSVVKIPPNHPCNIGVRVCAGEAGSHAGESPAGRIRRFATERDVRDEAARPNLQAGHLLNRQAITKVNPIQ